MSMYGDGEYYSQMNDIHEEMGKFLEEHPVSELLKIVSDVVGYKEWEAKDKAESEAQE